MKYLRQCLIALVLLTSLNARADIREQIPGSHYVWEGNYVTGAALYAACAELVSSIQNNVTTWCGAAAPLDNPNSYNQINGGWIQDRTQPPGVYKFYLLNAYACQSNDRVRYFADTKRCDLLTRYSMPIPSSPKGNGASCPANAQNRQPSCGNPIMVGTGNKVQLEKDFEAATPGLPMALIRTYNGGMFATATAAPGAFGRGWTEAVDRKLQPLPERTESVCFSRSTNGMVFCETRPVAGAGPAISITRPDGKIYIFTRSGDLWTGEADVDDRLSAHYGPDGVTPVGWTYVTAAQDTENYDADGRLISATSRAGASQRFTYSSGDSNDTHVSRLPADAPECAHVQPGAPVGAGLLLCVTDHWGRQIQFEYDARSRIIQVRDPAGQPYLYSYDGASAGCLPSAPDSLACAANNLTKVTFPDGKSRVYHYNESARINYGSGCSYTTASGNGFGHLLNTLTGVTDENGVRYASWSYDCPGRAVASEHAGGTEKVQISFGGRDSVTGAQTNTVTSFVGTAAAPATIVRSYHSKVILGVSRNDTVDQPCPGCAGMLARSYDSNGNVLSSKDWNGSITTYTYDLARNLETSRTEAAATTIARTTTTAWHPTLRVPLKIATPLQITTFTFDAAGNLLSQSIQASTDGSGAQGLNATVAGAARIWTYSYNDIGQPLTVTGPLGDISSLGYDGLGNLATATNPAGHMTTYSNYDDNGRVGQITDPNGLTTALTYTPRGWLSSISVGGERTDYEYDGAGQMTKVTLPGGATLTYVYDPAHRLTAIIDGDGNRISYTLNLAGSRIGEEVTDGSGTLVRKITRVYDTLNRLKQITGALQ